MICYTIFQRGKESKIYNTHVIINPDGEIAGSYSKLHLFDVHIPGKVRLCESDYTLPGEQISNPVSSPAGNIGLGVVSFICVYKLIGNTNMI